LKLCTQLAQPTEGEIIKDNRINIAHFHQLTVDNLPLNMTSIEYLRSLDSSLNESDCRARLGRIGLKKIDNLDIPKNTIDNLSGGQKARLAFAVIQLSSPEIILLDEPTNNLDITSIEALITAINAFNGGIIIITHDTHLIESIDKCELYEVKNSQLTKLSNDFESYKNKIVS
jgi:ATPase subunit of ABC transporter with duplicated ATPase domains